MMKNPVNRLFRKGISVYLKGNEVRLWGLNSLEPDQREKVIAYARKHKDRIIKTLKRKNPRCHGIVCSHARYDQLEGMPTCLWCGKTDKPVMGLGRCPEGYWGKDPKDFTLPEREEQ